MEELQLELMAIARSLQAPEGLQPVPPLFTATGEPGLLGLYRGSLRFSWFLALFLWGSCVICWVLKGLPGVLSVLW